MLTTPAHDYEKDLNGPSTATLGLFGQNSEDSALMATSAEEVVNYTEVTNNNNPLVVYVDSGASEHYFDDSPGLKGRLFD